MKQEQDKQEEENKVRKRTFPVDISNIGKLIYDVQQSENKKNKLLQPIYTQSFASKQQESKVSSEWLKMSLSRYDSQHTTQQAFQKHDITPPSNPLFSSSQANLSASKLVRTSSNPYLPINKSH